MTTRASLADDSSSWTFLTNHARVLVLIAADNDIRLSDLATAVGITVRATQAVVTDLVHAGYVERTRVGRRNHYTLDPDRPFRHPAEQDHAVGELIDVLRPAPDTAMTS